MKTGYMWGKLNGYEMAKSPTEDSEQIYIWVWLFGNFGLWFLLFSMIASSFFGSQGLEVLSVIASSLLSLALVALYLRQTTIQKQQTRIMERQEEWMESGHKPSVYINDWQIKDPTVRRVDGFRIGLINVGNGTATNLVLSTFIRPSLNNDITEIQRPDPEKCYRQRLRRTGSQGGETILEIGNTRTEFHSPVRFNIFRDEEINYGPETFGNVVDKLVKDGEETAIVGFLLSYYGINSIQQRRLFYSFTFKLPDHQDTDLDLKQAIRTGSRIYGPDDETVPSETRST